jgi:hypothetical protein
MKVAISMVSYRADLHWLSYSLRFLRRNFKEPGTEIVVRVEPDCREIIETWKIPCVRYIYVEPWTDGYHFQMYMKLMSDTHTDADLIICVDSDLMLLRPVYLDDIIIDGKVPIDFLPWHESPEAERVWRGPTSRLMGMDLHCDMMAGSPFPFWRDTFGKVRDHIEKTNGISYGEALYSTTPFTTAGFHNHQFKWSDYEAMNLYASTHQSDRYFLRSRHSTPFPWPWRLYWSRGDWSDELQAEFERRLA